ncbi:MAG: hypothetical protein IV100_02805 [Myxococcales bacterium]|nr:hypothetical protein [Myxococcales bacterium]
MTDATPLSAHAEAVVSARPEVLTLVLRALAAAVPEERRTLVKAQIDAAASSTEPEFTVELYPGLDDDDPGRDVVAEAESLSKRLEDGHYFRELSWDEEVQQERAFGDESWARELDDFFARAATTYLSGNDILASHLYARLLGVFRFEGRPGVFCGVERPQEMVETNLAVAKRRYLRAVYRTTRPDMRPRRLLSDIISFRDIGESDLLLRDIAFDTSDGDTPLDDVDTFLGDWVRWLDAVDREPPAVGRDIRRLLREAVMLQSGADGLGELARREGASHPEAWHDWVGALIRAGRDADAVKAARDGLVVIADASYKARLGDRLAALAERRGDLTLAVDASRAAFRAHPTEVRLLQLVAAADAAGECELVLEREAGEVTRPAFAHGDALAARVLLLAGRFEEALTRFQRSDAIGWGRPDHAGSIVLPFLLVAGANLDGPPPGTALARLWEDLDTPARTYFDRRLLLDQMTADDGVEPEHRAYSVLLVEALARHRPPESQRARLLQLAQVKVEVAARDILQSHHRRGQAVAALLTVAMAEALAAARGLEVGESFLRSARRPYPRDSAYRKGLDALTARSALLKPVS